MWLLEPLHVGRGAQPTAPEAGALPETGRYRVTFQKSKSYRLLVLTVRFTLRNGAIRVIGAGYWRKQRRLYEKAQTELHE